VDTRKTTPGWRALEKYAVRLGGGRNHRFGLYDAVLIKNNHLTAVGSITQAVRLARANAPQSLRVEVEVADLAGLQEALNAGADIIMLDNMDEETMARAVAITAGRAELEASGGMTQERLTRVAATGVNFISMGALTHSAPAADIHLRLVRVAVMLVGEGQGLFRKRSLPSPHPPNLQEVKVACGPTSRID
jgi:nicotinate-nucleotide pyrophosphorylase (carboxylating)